jgi:hypothetical protein
MVVPAFDPAYRNRRLKPMDPTVRDHAGSILPLRHMSAIFFFRQSQAQAIFCSRVGTMTKSPQKPTHWIRF